MEGRCYHIPCSYCPTGISKGDKMLLYCCRGYPGCDKEAPALGEVIYKEECEGKVFVYYEYRALVPPIKRVAINECLSKEERGKFRNPRNKPSWLSEIKPTSFWCAVGGREVG